MRSLLFFLSGVVVVVLIEFGRSSPPPHAETIVRAPDPAPVNSVAVADRGRAAPSERDREIASISGRLAALEASNAMATPSGPPDAGSPAGEEQPVPRLSTDELLVRLEDNHRDQRVDPRWSRETEADINDAFAEFGVGELLSVSCRSTLCRLEMSYEDIADFDRFLTQAPQIPPFDTEGFFQRLDRDPDSVPTFVVFIARSGHGLPSEPEGE